MDHSSATSDKTQYSLRTLLNAVAVVSIGLAIFAYLIDRERFTRSELTRLAKLDKETLANVISEVEAIRTQLGRVPADEIELQTLMGKPMPVVHDGLYPTNVNYQRTGVNSFILQYELFATDDWIYDSKKPEAGWVQHWY